MKDETQPSFAARRAIEEYQRSASDFKLACQAMLKHVDETQRERLTQFIKAL